MKYLTKEVKIGITGIVAIAVLVYGLNFLKGINVFKAGNGYYVEFEDIAGLVTSSPVYADGYGIGLVREIQYDYRNPGHVVVEIELDREVKLPIGTTAELETEMLGTVKMNLKLPRGVNRWYVQGDTLQGVVNAGVMGKAAGLVPKVEMMMPKLDSILMSLNNLLADQSLANTLHNAEQVTANLQITTERLNGLLASDIPAIAGNLNMVTENLAVISTNLKDIDYASTVARIDATLEGVKQFTDQLQSKENTVGMLLNDRALYDNLLKTTGNASALLEDLKEHPKRYVHFSLFGHKEK
ncbi:MAG: MCE family protein [Bacteroidaceae bacterium]|nr:MCE family protein [Bacteroidaceae bacterium]